jgi:[ribosomal protein S18]-alanine N-acetyltransferase
MLPADIEQVAAIDAVTNDSAWPVAVFADQLKLSQARSLVAYHDARRIVGFCVYWVVADEMQLLAIATAPASQRCGVATRLLDSACSEAMSAGASHVTLEVRSSNDAAMRFYDRCGFHRQALRKAYYQNGVDAVLMRAEMPILAGR